MNDEALQHDFWSSVDGLLSRTGRNLKDLAESTGLKYQTVIGWRTYKRLPNLRSALSIADFLGVSVEVLCGRAAMPVDVRRAFNDMLESSDGALRRNLSDAGRLDEARAVVDDFSALMEEMQAVSKKGM